MTERIVYVTSSPFKIEEAQLIQKHLALADGVPVADLFEFDFRGLTIPERLEVSLEEMVRSEVRDAYKQLKVPCIVEHAGLIFDTYSAEQYPGGLTKPMWNTLRDRFIAETQSANREATARAAVAYCDGMSVRTFIGETSGVLADSPRGARAFYWDTVFIPTDSNVERLTYAEIVSKADGLLRKVQEYSQSTKAIVAFLEWRRSNPPRLWS